MFVRSLSLSDLSSLEFYFKGSAICLPNLFKELCNFKAETSPLPVAYSLVSLSIFSPFLARFFPPAPNWECKCPTFFLPRNTYTKKKMKIFFQLLCIKNLNPTPCTV